jgi:hypothetical protein
MEQKLINEKLKEYEGMAVAVYPGQGRLRGFVYNKEVYIPEIKFNELKNEISFRLILQPLDTLYGIEVIDEGQLSSLEKAIFNAFQSESFRINLDIPITLYNLER